MKYVVPAFVLNCQRESIENNSSGFRRRNPEMYEELQAMRTNRSMQNVLPYCLLLHGRLPAAYRHRSNPSSLPLNILCLRLLAFVFPASDFDMQVATLLIALIPPLKQKQFQLNLISQCLGESVDRCRSTHNNNEIFVSLQSDFMKLFNIYKWFGMFSNRCNYFRMNRNGAKCVESYFSVR